MILTVLCVVQLTALCVVLMDVFGLSGEGRAGAGG